MTDFNAFRNAVLEDDDLQEQVLSIVNTAAANGSGLGDGIATVSQEPWIHHHFRGGIRTRRLPWTGRGFDRLRTGDD